MSLTDATPPVATPAPDPDPDPEPMATATPLPWWRQPWVPYVAPMATFLGLTTLEDYLPRTAPGAATIAHYPAVYALKIATVTLVLWWCRGTTRDLRPWPGWRAIGAGIALGLAVALVWVGADGYYPVYGTIGTRAAYDPSFLAPGGRLLFLLIRFYGLVLVVPVMEELFWRSFVVRWLVDPDRFEAVPIGRVTLAAASITAGLFALEHPAEWLPALLTGFAWAGLLARTRSVAACVASHAAANLALGVYVLVTGDWKFW